jgi:hypothetical protein
MQRSKIFLWELCISQREMRGISMSTINPTINTETKLGGLGKYLHRFSPSNSSEAETTWAMRRWRPSYPWTS